MKKLKRFFAILPALLAALCLIIVLWYTILNYNLSQGNTDLEYIIDESTNTITITGFSSDKTTIRIPETILGMTVVAIDDYAFKNNSNVIDVHIPSSVKHIGKGAFYNCDNLAFIWDLEKCKYLTEIEDEVFYNCKRLKHVKLPTNITSIGNSTFKSCHRLVELSIPDSVVSIGKHAFDNCQSIKEIKIPRGVDRIEEGTFLGCISMKSIVLPEGITHIGYAAFNICRSLESILIPSTVNVIEEGAFLECHSLPSIDVASDNPTYTSIDGVLYDMDITELIAYPSGKTDKTYSIPQGVTKISKAVFAYNQHLDTLNIPASINTINNYFLYDASVKTVNYGGSVSSWNSIEKIGGLDFGESFIKIICTDGTIAMDGTVTYN